MCCCASRWKGQLPSTIPPAPSGRGSKPCSPRTLSNEAAPAPNPRPMSWAIRQQRVPRWLTGSGGLLDCGGRQLAGEVISALGTVTEISSSVRRVELGEAADRFGREPLNSTDQQALVDEPIEVKGRLAPRQPQRRGLVPAHRGRSCGTRGRTGRGGSGRPASWTAATAPATDAAPCHTL